MYFNAHSFAVQLMDDFVTMKKKNNFTLPYMYTSLGFTSDWWLYFTGTVGL